MVKFSIVFICWHTSEEKYTTANAINDLINNFHLEVLTRSKWVRLGSSICGCFRCLKRTGISLLLSWWSSTRNTWISSVFVYIFFSGLKKVALLGGRVGYCHAQLYTKYPNGQAIFIVALCKIHISVHFYIHLLLPQCFFFSSNDVLTEFS